MIKIHNKISNIHNKKCKISIIIPCRNEEKFISECLDSIIANDYPEDKLEILVVDGLSEDRTREIVKRYIEQFPYIKLLNNSKKYTPFALNIGIKQAKGDTIMLMGSHATYSKDYISKSIKYLKEYKADNVGGVVKIISKDNTLIAKAIVLAPSSFFGAGNAYYKIGNLKGAKFVDTVFGGCYKKEIFSKIGFFNENLIKNQDFELNLRLRRFGGKILFVSDIIAYYYAKSNLVDFAKHNFRDAFWVIYPLKFNIKAFSWRHLIPLFFVLSLLGTLFLGIIFSFFFWLFFTIIILYVLINLYFSARVAAVQKDLKYFFLMPIVFTVRHIFYGLGSLWGLCKNVF